MVPGGGRRGSTDAGALTGSGGAAVVVLPSGIKAEVSVAGQFGGASAGALGQVAFGQRLQAPDDAFDQPGAVAGGGGLAEDFSEALPQLAHGKAL
jgi:hypothetical protein